ERRRALVVEDAVLEVVGAAAFPQDRELAVAHAPHAARRVAAPARIVDRHRPARALDGAEEAGVRSHPARAVLLDTVEDLRRSADAARDRIEARAFHLLATPVSDERGIGLASLESEARKHIASDRLSRAVEARVREV